MSPHDVDLHPVGGLALELPTPQPRGSSRCTANDPSMRLSFVSRDWMSPWRIEVKVMEPLTASRSTWYGSPVGFNFCVPQLPRRLSAIWMSGGGSETGEPGGRSNCAMSYVPAPAEMSDSI